MKTDKSVHERQKEAGKRGRKKVLDIRKKKREELKRRKRNGEWWLTKYDL